MSGAAPAIGTDRGGDARPQSESRPRNLDQLWTLTARQVKVVLADPKLVVLTLFQPIVLLLLFTQIFGRMANPALFPAGSSYTDYLVPALLVMAGIGTAQSSGIGIVRDSESGILQRFRFMPVRPFFILVARSLGDLARTALQLAALVVCAYLALGFDPAGGWTGMLGATLLSLLVCWTLIWLFLALATWLRSVEILGSIGFFVTTPLMFASSAFIPLDVLPGWVQVVARINPLTYAVNASRGLAGGDVDGATIAGALISSTVMIGIMATIALFGFVRPSNPSTRGN